MALFASGVCSVCIVRLGLSLAWGMASGARERAKSDGQQRQDKMEERKFVHPAERTQKCRLAVVIVSFCQASSWWSPGTVIVVVVAAGAHGYG